MKCPFCGHAEDKVVDSREGKEGRVVRRRRECLSCARRFTTYERVDEIPYMVVKKDGRREPFDRNKLLTGLVKACEKRPVPMSVLEKVVDEIENLLQESPEKELPAAAIGERLMGRLRDLDQVAYVRFASVYRQFGDLNEFMEELKTLLGQRK
ncbi:MAG TPA: transcriptional regulator NrdR [Candidatus Polarisedimenticolia bacterium]|jgi:transcriptional repressor NrdR|nr:transcriptional regulator NrdR [Candidatus Polarisedimenticolia bacterium]